MKNYILSLLILSIISNYGYCQSISFSADSVDSKQMVTQFSLDKQVYMHVDFGKELDLINFYPDGKKIPLTGMKLYRCDFHVRIKTLDGSNIVGGYGYDRDGYIGKNIDFKSSKIIIPILSTNQYAVQYIADFFSKVETGVTNCQIEVIPISNSNYPSKKYIPSATIDIRKDEGVAVKINKTFEGDFEAGQSNPELEAKVLKAMIAKGKDLNFSSKYLGTKIISRTWTLVRDKYTNDVLGRKILCYIYAKSKEGYCYVEKSWFWEEFDGVNYSNYVLFYQDSIDKSEKVDCEE